MFVTVGLSMQSYQNQKQPEIQIFSEQDLIIIYLQDQFDLGKLFLVRSDFLKKKVYLI